MIALAAFVQVFTDLYGENSGIAGVHYLAIALGSTGTDHFVFYSDLMQL